MELEAIRATAQRILASLPPGVTLLAAAKTRTLAEVEAVIQAGVRHIGYNYVQEALPVINALGGRAAWHMIGHLQKNKARLAVEHFDLIETVDSWELAQVLERQGQQQGKTLPVLIEVNSGREANKSGLLPEAVEDLARQISTLHQVRLEGLMTMGPLTGDPEESRPYFKTTRAIFDRLAEINLPNVRMKTLSMGMSNSYRVAIEEGANLIRLGTLLFGERR